MSEFNYTESETEGQGGKDRETETKTGDIRYCSQLLEQSCFTTGILCQNSIIQNSTPEKRLQKENNKEKERFG